MIKYRLYLLLYSKLIGCRCLGVYQSSSLSPIHTINLNDQRYSSLLHLWCTFTRSITWPHCMHDVCVCCLPLLCFTATMFTWGKCGTIPSALALNTWPKFPTPAVAYVCTNNKYAQ